jgi:hypothetical protein
VTADATVSGVLAQRHPFGLEQSTSKGTPMPEIILNLSGGTFTLSGGKITSDLHFDSLKRFLEDGEEEPGDPLDDQFNYGWYEGAIDAVESMILAAAEAGIDVQGKPFLKVIQLTLDAIGNEI